MYIDTHCHLTDARFDADRAGTISRAESAGVEHIIEIACDPGKWQTALELAKSTPAISCAMGIHPQDASLMSPETFSRLAQLCSTPEVVAIGETGLDYYHENSPRDVQKESFAAHIGLARRLGKPLVIHCRNAYADLFPVLDEAFAKHGAISGVVHCFSGTPADAERILSLGLYIGIDGPVTYPGSSSLRETVKMTPLARLLLETDAPYLPPQQYRGKRNEPAYLEHIARGIAAANNTPVETIALATTTNARKLFGI